MKKIPLLDYPNIMSERKKEDIVLDSFLKTKLGLKTLLKFASQFGMMQESVKTVVIEYEEYSVYVCP